MPPTFLLTNLPYGLFNLLVEHLGRHVLVTFVHPLNRYMRHRYWTGTDVKEVPSEYFHRQVSLGFQIDKVALRNLGVIGEDRIMWANDFPHVVTDWPNSRRVITEQFFGVAEDTKAKILAGNAVRFYRLDN